MITTHETVKKGIAGIKELFGQSSVYGSTKENFGTYRPLTMSLFAVEWNFFKDNPFPYHLVHVLLYAFLCMTIFTVLKQLLQEYHPLLPFVSTLFFVSHPVHTEVAANIKSADEILSLLFCLLALGAGINYVSTSRIKFGILSLIAFFAGLLSKESSATFLLIIPLSAFLFLSASRKQLFVLFSFYALAMAVYFLMRNAALDPSPPIGLVNNSLAGASDFSLRYGTVFVILLKYLLFLFFPHSLSWDYGYNQIPLVNFANPIAIISLLIYLTIGTVALKGIFRFSNSKVSKLISFCILFFLISLSVSSNIFILIGSTMAERFLFTPSLGFCIFLSFILIKFLKINSLNLHLKLIPLVIIIALYSCKTFTRNADWKDNLTLFGSAVNVCPNSYRVNSSFAWESVLAAERAVSPEEKKKYYRDAVIYYNKATAIYPSMESDWYNCGVAQSNLGNIAEAEKMYLYALRVNPKHRNSHYNLAGIYMNRKDYPNALKHFSEIYQTEPAFMDVAFKIGLIHHLSGSPQAAIPYYEQYYKNNPTNKDVINNLMMAYNAVGNIEKANEFAQKLQHLR